MNYYKRNDRGVILIIVLWVLFFLAIAATTLSYQKRVSVRLHSLRNEEMRMLYLAKEGITRCVIKLAEDETEFDSLLEDWSKEFSLESEGAILTCRIVDEDRFLNINTASDEILNNLKNFSSQLSKDTIETMIKTRPFNVAREIMDAIAIDEEVFYGNADLNQTGLKELITVFSDGKVNINTVSKDILVLFPQITEPAAQSIIDRRNSVPFQENETLSQELSLIGLTPGQISSILKFIKVESPVYRIFSKSSSLRKDIIKEIEVVLKEKDGRFKVLFVKES